MCGVFGEVEGQDGRVAEAEAFAEGHGGGGGEGGGGDAGEEESEEEGEVQESHWMTGSLEWGGTRWRVRAW